MKNLNLNFKIIDILEKEGFHSGNISNNIYNSNNYYIGDFLLSLDMGFIKKLITSDTYSKKRTWIIFENNNCIITHRDLSECNTTTWNIIVKKTINNNI